MLSGSLQHQRKCLPVHPPPGPSQGSPEQTEGPAFSPHWPHVEVGPREGRAVGVRRRRGASCKMRRALRPPRPLDGGPGLRKHVLTSWHETAQAHLPLSLLKPGSATSPRTRCEQRHPCPFCWCSQGCGDVPRGHVAHTCVTSLPSSSRVPARLVFLRGCQLA